MLHAAYICLFSRRFQLEFDDILTNITTNDGLASGGRKGGLALINSQGEAGTALVEILDGRTPAQLQAVFRDKLHRFGFILQIEKCILIAEPRLFATAADTK